MTTPATTADIARHQNAHAHLFGHDYRWHHNGVRWTLQPESPQQREQRLLDTLRQLNAGH